MPRAIFHDGRRRFLPITWDSMSRASRGMRHAKLKSSDYDLPARYVLIPSRGKTMMIFFSRHFHSWLTRTLNQLSRHSLSSCRRAGYAPRFRMRNSPLITSFMSRIGAAISHCTADADAFKHGHQAARRVTNAPRNDNAILMKKTYLKMRRAAHLPSAYLVAADAADAQSTIMPDA